MARLAPVAALATGAMIATMVPPPALAQSASPRAGRPATAAPRVAAPGAAASSTGTEARAVRSQVVTLVTGDRLKVTSYSDGRSTSTLLPGSPSFGKPVRTVTAGSDTYVIPFLKPADRGRIDISLFNVTRQLALRQADATLPVEVTFDKGVAPHRVAGIQLDSAQRRTKSGVTTAAGTYDLDGAALTNRGSAAWRGVASVSLPAVESPRPTGRYKLHTLTIHMREKGKPVSFAEAFVMNVDDARLLTAPILISNGIGKVSVPEGNYSVFVSSFSSWLAIKDDFAVTKETGITLRAGDATSRPTVKVKHTKPVESDVTISRVAEKGGSLSYGTIGEDFDLRVTPVAKPPHGTFETIFGATLAPRSTKQGAAPSKLVYTKVVRSGFPASLHPHFTKSDFAVVSHRYYGTGKKRQTYSYVYPFAPQEFFAFILGVPTTIPAKRTLWLQGSDSLVWLQAVDALFTFSPLKIIELSAPFQKFAVGQKKTYNWFRGPFGPGLERGADRSAGDFCLLCRSGNDLDGSLPLYNPAGTNLDSFSLGKVGDWSLKSGHRTLERGRGDISPHVTLPAGKKRYHLMATSKPGLRAWQLSSKVTDNWAFSSARGNQVVPILIPSYVPTDRLDGTAAAGSMSYRLNFNNLGPVAAKVTAATVSYSVDDGRHWTRAKLNRLDKNTFRVRYANPRATKRHPYVSLKVTGRDSGGRHVVETVIHAYTIGSGGPSAKPGATSATNASATTAASPGAAAVTSAVARDQRQLARALRDPGHAKGASRACANQGRHFYRCFALIEKAGGRAAARAVDPSGWGADDLRDAYGLTGLGTSRQKVAVTVAYDYPSAEADMNRYRRQFGLPACTSASGCFTKINQNGETKNYPAKDQGWALEAALDLQMISAACPTCRIVLAEANQPSTGSLSKAIDAAVAAGAVVTNHSYGIAEYGGILKANRHYAPKGVTSVAATGDFGYEPATFPASSPKVVSVGGTVLRHAGNPRGWGEHAWSYGGSGCSAYFAKPGWQHDRACGNRTYGDLSAVADGLAVYDTFLPKRYKGWLIVGGTSASSPFVAGLIGAARAGGLKPAALYGNGSAYNDVRKGSNGYCLGSYMCTAKPGYDAPTGWGTPKGLTPFRR